MAEGSRKGNRPPDRPARVGSQDDRVQNPGTARLGLGARMPGEQNQLTGWPGTIILWSRSARLRRRRMETEGTKKPEGRKRKE